MNGISNFPTRSGGLRRAVIAAIAVVSPGLPAGASAIRSHSSHIHAAQSLTSSQVNNLRAWSSFLAGGETLWASVHAPPITPLIREAVAQAVAGPDPIDSPIVQYLEWRRDLDPTRFDHWHPHLGPELGNLTPPITTTPIPTPTPSGELINPPPIVKPAIPEPNTCAIALALFGGGVWWRRRSRPGS